MFEFFVRNPPKAFGLRLFTGWDTPPMAAKQSKTAVFEAAGAQFSLTVEGRNAGVLYGPEPFMKPGSIFLRCLGVFDNYTVAGGLPVWATAVCKRMRLYGASELLRQGLARDSDLLSFDDNYTLPGAKTRLKGNSYELSIRGFGGSITAQPRGYCTVELKEQAPDGFPRTVELIDARSRRQIVTDRGPLRIHKRPAEFTLLEPISRLVDFLKQHHCDEVAIRFA